MSATAVAPARLSPEQIESFEEQGYLVVEDIIPPEWVAEIRADLHNLHERMADDPPEGVHLSWEHEVDPNIQRRIKQLMHAEVVSPALNRLVRSPEVLDVIEALMGPNISLYHCKLLMKAAKDGTVTPWHQDYWYWEMEGNRPLMLNCMLQIDDATPENGCIQMVPGSQKHGLMPHESQGKVFGRFLPGYFQPREDAVAVPMRAGSAIFFGPLIIHGSDANRSDNDRRAVTIAYNVTGNRTSMTRGVLRGRPVARMLRKHVARFVAVPVVIAAVVSVLASSPALAWWPKGHSIIAEGAVRTLPKEIPDFFRRGSKQIAHGAQDPDVLKVRALTELRDAEDPEHYYDEELLKGKTLPPIRSAFIKLCIAEGLDPKNVGYVPYLVTEWTQRLAVAFAEHRKWPRNPYIRDKCLVYAGMLAHYAGDLCQPLHVTVEFDGRLPKDGSPPRRGIHAKMDALIEKLALKPADLARGQTPVAFDPIMPAVLAEIAAARTHVDQVYKLDQDLPPETGAWKPTPEVTELGTERGRASVKFLASLYLTAWRKSATVELPPWLERE